MRKESGEKERMRIRLRVRSRKTEKKRAAKGGELCILSAGCLIWVVDSGRGAKAYGAHLPVRA